MDQRKRLILSAIVSAYIETGEPVGSKTLLIRENLGVSPATIRNEMSELERLGYLKKTHTSSGRVPSNLGYRFYVGTLTPYRLTKKERETLNSSLENSAGFEEVLEASTQNLANFSGCTVFGISPNFPDGIYQFEVLPAGKRILAIMVIASGGSVKNYFYRATEDVSLK
ncbi:MAG: DeoR family transcriptional regulator, partial [Clostridia bacterium]|nr:DeoR family transcriptional regulator [Clostridia bacterium]